MGRNEGRAWNGKGPGVTKPEQYELRWKPTPGPWRTAPDQRLRAALKVLLRAYGLRCVSARPIAAKEDKP